MILLKNIKKYEKIAELIEEMIIDSGFKVGDRLPSVNALCELFNVAPATMCNSLEQLRDRGIIKSFPRKGNFISKLPEPEMAIDQETADFLEHCSPVSSIFSPRIKTLKVFIEEYKFPGRKRFWNRLIAGFQSRHRDIQINVCTDPMEASDADVILGTHSSWPDLVTESQEEVDQLQKGVNFSEYFPSALVTSHKDRHFANLPFAVSQELRLWNCQLAEKYCPDVLTDVPRHIISYIIDNCDYQSPDFPVVGSFIHFFPVILMEEGIDILNRETGQISFDHPRIPDILTFNRCMYQKMLDRPEWTGQFRIDYFWQAFVQGEIMALDTFSYALPIIPEKPSFGIKVQSTTIDHYQSSTAVSQTFGLGISCQDIENAIKFIRFACGRSGQKLLAESRCNIPALRCIAEHKDFLSRCPDNMASVLKDLYHETSVLTEFEIFDQTKYGYLQDFTMDYLEGKKSLSETMKCFQSKNIIR